MSQTQIISQNSIFISMIEFHIFDIKESSILSLYNYSIQFTILNVVASLGDADPPWVVLFIIYTCCFYWKSFDTCIYWSLCYSVFDFFSLGLHFSVPPPPSVKIMYIKDSFVKKSYRSHSSIPLHRNNIGER